MLTVTHLGHSGWLCQSEDRAVLVDPLFQVDFGRGPGKARMPSLWPPRLFSFEKFPALDAVIISHEHEDHFNLPSLAMIDRSIPVYMPVRSSVAASTILPEMGFDCRHLIPGEPVRFGSLELLPLSPDFVTRSHGDEWDVLALWFRNIIHGGTFFTTVDVSAGDEMIRRLEASQGDHQGLLFHNAGEISWTTLQDIPALPLQGEDATAEHQANACDVLNSGKSRHVRPGESISVSDSQVLSFRESMPFVSTPARPSWGNPPAWRYHPHETNYPPACDKLEISDADLETLDSGLLELAQFMYGREIFKSLFSLSPTSAKCALSFLLLLISDSERHYYALEYCANSCSFESVSTEHPFKEYLCGIECWATDLVALFRGDFEPRILSLGHSRHWSHHPAVPDPFTDLIWPFFHPLRRPAECLNRYRAQFQSVSSTRILISRNTEGDEMDRRSSGESRMTA